MDCFLQSRGWGHAIASRAVGFGRVSDSVRTSQTLKAFSLRVCNAAEAAVH